MGQKIDEFCNDLRNDLTEADNRLQGLKGQIEKANEETRDAIETKLQQAKSDLEAQKRKAEDRQHEVKSYLEEKRAEAKHDIDDWKKKRELKKLEKRAERRESYAADTLLFAMAAIDEANVAVLEALEARLDADDAEAATA
jgi:chromosome segregation ATPase